MKFLPGDLVKVKTRENYSPEGLQLAVKVADKIKLHERIDLESFPSSNDFEGYNKLFKNETLLVIGKKGRPLSFSTKEKWEIYDVYVLMHENRTYECFFHCLEKISDAKP